MNVRDLLADFKGADEDAACERYSMWCETADGEIAIAGFRWDDERQRLILETDGRG